VKADEFTRTRHRIFGIMPGFRQTAKLDPAMKKAEQLGFRSVLLSELLFQVEAREAGKFFAAVCKTIEHSGKPFEPPCALFSSGEMVVTVGNENGVGGRNQEFSLSAAKYISGSENIAIGSVDTDGTDGPGTQFSHAIEGMPDCLAGGVVDGNTVREAETLGLDIDEAIRKHDSSPILWKLGCGIDATPNISLVDLTVGIVMARSYKEEHLYY
jgi:glycerate-2-kinase